MSTTHTSQITHTPAHTHSGTLKSTSRPVSMLSPHKSWDEASGRSQEHTDLSPSRHDLYHLTRRSGLAGFDSLTVGQKGESLLNLDEVWLYCVCDLKLGY